DLGLNATQLGLAFSAFAYPYAFFQVFGGWFGDHVGARRTLLGCGIVVAATTIATGLAGGLASLFAVRLALGFGEGAAFPTATRAMAAWLPRESWGYAQGVTHSAARLGNAITPPIISALILALSWRASFVIVGTASLAWVVAWMALLPAGPDARGTPRRARHPVHALASAVPAHPAGHRGGFLLRLDALAVSQLAAEFLPERLPPRLRNRAGRSAGLRTARRRLSRPGLVRAIRAVKSLIYDWPSW